MPSSDSAFQPFSPSALSSPVLVTGGTGFLGRHIVERLLAQGRPVTVLARRVADDLVARGVHFIAASLDDAGAMRDACAGIHTVFHVAAKVGVWGRYDDFFRANVIGTRALLAGAREHGVRCFVHTSTPSVVYNDLDLAGADESLPLTTRCPSAYPLTKAIAEREVLAANSPGLRTVALRPHLIWGNDDPHLIPRVLAQARRGRLRIVGDGRNRVDMVHVENATDAHLLAETNIGQCAGRAYFITNNEPVVLWEWINNLLVSLGERPVGKRISLRAASAIGACCEAAWRVLPLRGEPPMTRFVASELAKDHWFNATAAHRDIGYTPRVSMAGGTAALVESLKAK
ncbi:nucleoside-diphosphate-sugar epimerase [Ereboglobus sp. PH5-5]|uniref:NAD-dependent epimerase/dehydratase family protein n=1 Tax=Ereboglobus sp. PH5-5 TaxID=2940529 RepID=UPI00240561A2|nr:NAD-dependent epimerase/dehydratase family protein [Ereboglobus sp. PH5-5]MDF9833876.1 nucleoside-diphosphate-sugar epimerase [Ereboglobus sp. PH5-5]